jgi:hypothetical protein
LHELSGIFGDGSEFAKQAYFRTVHGSTSQEPELEITLILVSKPQEVANFKSSSIPFAPGTIDQVTCILTTFQNEKANTVTVRYIFVEWDYSEATTAI